MLRDSLWRERAKTCMKKLDSIESANFDISVVRHMIEGGRFDVAEEFLITGMNEIEKSVKDGFLKAEDGYGMIHTIEDQVFPFVQKKEFNVEVMKIVVDLQFKLAEELYMAIWKCMRFM